jgi:hypothetical protein
MIGWEASSRTRGDSDSNQVVKSWYKTTDAYSVHLWTEEMSCGTSKAAPTSCQYTVSRRPWPHLTFCCVLRGEWAKKKREKLHNCADLCSCLGACRGGGGDEAPSGELVWKAKARADVSGGGSSDPGVQAFVDQIRQAGDGRWLALFGTGTFSRRVWGHIHVCPEQQVGNGWIVANYTKQQFGRIPCGCCLYVPL